MEELQSAKQNNVQYEEGNEIRKIENQIHNMLPDEEIY